jgi:hypothetical protein
VLAGLGTAGLGLGTSMVLFTGEGRAFTTYTRVPASQQGPPEQEGSSSSQSQSDRHGLRVAWWESYNGQVVETQGDGSETDVSDVLGVDSDPTFVPEAAGPVVSVGNVLPGDEGTVGIGIEADLPGNQDLAVWFRTVLVSTAENGVNEPESKVDDSPDEGEMDDMTQVTVWENSGLAGIGANDGEIVPVVENVVGEGSIREVFGNSDLADGIRLGSNCLADGEVTYLALRWELPTDVGNVVQSDSVTFGLEFQDAPCGAGNPFGGSGNGNGGNGNGNGGNGNGNGGNGNGNGNGNGGNGGNGNGGNGNGGGENDG